MLLQALSKLLPQHISVNGCSSTCQAPTASHQSHPRRVPSAALLTQLPCCALLHNAMLPPRRRSHAHATHTSCMPRTPLAWCPLHPPRAARHICPLLGRGALCTHKHHTSVLLAACERAHLVADVAAAVRIRRSLALALRRATAAPAATAVAAAHLAGSSTAALSPPRAAPPLRLACCLTFAVVYLPWSCREATV